MTATSTDPPAQTDPPVEDVVLTALARLGQATAAAVAAQAGLAYSTATRRLRTLEQAAAAQRFRDDDGRTLWRATTTAAAGEPPAAANPAAAGAEPDPARGVDNAGPVPDGGPAEPGPAATDATAPGGETTAEPAAGTDAQPAAGPASAEPAGDQAAPTAGPHAPPGREPGGQPGARPAPNAGGEAKVRRRKGALREAVLAVLQDHPQDTFKVSELAKASGLVGASQGAIANALHTLVNQGTARQVAEKPATYQAE
jgi:hypothetical protein